MKIQALPALADNYIWILERSKGVIVVDPGEAAPVREYLEKTNQPLLAILLTHYHDDHVGGVKELRDSYPNVPVYGPEETKGWATQLVTPNETLIIEGLLFEVFLTAGHTEGHVSYLVEDKLFCGDALFAAGCGRVFTKDYEAQYEALQKFAALPDNTKVYAGHEYTVTNLRFASQQKPDNETIRQTLHEAIEKRATGEPTLPSTVAREKETNLFLTAETVEEFRELRNKRDSFQ